MNERADGFYKQYIEKRLSVFPINSYSDVINNCKEYTWFNVFGDKFLHQIAGLYLRLGDQEKAKEFYGYEAALYEDSGLFYKSANIHEQFLENTVKADELIRLGLKKSLEKSDFDHLELFFDYMDNSMKAEAIHKAARSCHFEEAATLCNKAGNPEMENVYVELDEIFSR